MTVKEFYEIVKARSAENCQLTFDYICDDDDYDCEGIVEQTDLHIVAGEVCISISKFISDIK